MTKRTKRQKEQKEQKDKKNNKTKRTKRQKEKKAKKEFQIVMSEQFLLKSRLKWTFYLSHGPNYICKPKLSF